jgi:hypothetical protein
MHSLKFKSKNNAIMAALKCGLLRVMLKCHATLNLKFSGASANLKNRFTNTQLQVVQIQTALCAICLAAMQNLREKNSFT